MAAIVPRRFFDDFEDEQDASASSAAELRAQGLIRVHGTITIKLNDRLKALARKQGIHATDFIGQLITKSADELDRIEAQLEAERLRERFGDDWIEILKQVNQ